MPHYTEDGDRCGKCMDFDIDKNSKCYTSEGFYYQGMCLMNDAEVSENHVCDYFNKES